MTKKSKGRSISKKPKISFETAILLFCLIFSFPLRVAFSASAIAASDAREGNREALPIWWSDTEKRADSAGYQLITPRDLEALLQSGEPFVLLDVRPDYEYREDHIPGAVNLEFHLGHRSRVEPAHREAVKKLLGDDPEQKVVIYCRNFR